MENYNYKIIDIYYNNQTKKVSFKIQRKGIITELFIMEKELFEELLNNIIYDTRYDIISHRRGHKTIEKCKIYEKYKQMK